MCVYVLCLIAHSSWPAFSFPGVFVVCFRLVEKVRGGIVFYC